MVTTLVLLAAMAAAGAPPPNPGHDAMKAPAAAPRQPVPLFTDLGSFHRAITTKNKLAQKYFDQGMRLLYGFNHDEAERAFREAARLEPRLDETHDDAALAGVPGPRERADAAGDPSGERDTLAGGPICGRHAHQRTPPCTGPAGGPGTPEGCAK